MKDFKMLSLGLFVLILSLCFLAEVPPKTTYRGRLVEPVKKEQAENMSRFHIFSKVNREYFKVGFITTLKLTKKQA